MLSSPRDIIELCNRITEGEWFDYSLFWDGLFSQWYWSPFEIGGVSYLTAEHYMMSEKALLFNDQVALAIIRRSDSPSVAKQAGRAVQGFDFEIWKKHRFDIVVRGSMGKYSQNPTLLKPLLDTGNDIIVEASPEDNIWGIGLPEKDPKAKTPHEWHGLNLLGFALMEVRERLRADHE